MFHSDTKLTAKSLVFDITTHAPTLINTPQGRRALFYLLVPRSRRHFTPAQITIIAETDSIRGKTSKKSADVREGEIRTAASEGLLKFVEDNGAEAARDTGGSLVVLEIMLYADGGWCISLDVPFFTKSWFTDKSAAIQSLLQPLASTYPSEDASKPHPIDLPHTSRMYKSLFQGGHFSHSTKSVIRSPSFSPSAFASAFMVTVGKDVTIAMAGGEGAFVIAEFLQRIIEDGSIEERRTVKNWFDEEVDDSMKKSETKGRNVLLEKIDALSS